MTKKIIVLLSLVFLCVGCGFLKQGYEDYKLGTSAPLEPGEKSAKDQSRDFFNMFSGLPYVGPFMPIVASVGTPIFAIWRGRNKRKGLPTSTKPITGVFGNSIGAELVVQTATDFLTGISEWGKDGSPLKRGIKVGISTVTALVIAAISFPQVQQILLANPEIGVLITSVSSAFAAIEKASSKVLPVQPAPVA